MAKGWVKIWRKIWASDIWDDEEPFCKRAAWIDLILMANHEPHEIMIDGKPVTIELPSNIEMEVKESAPGVKGDTATAATKEAVLQTGLRIQVLLFINPGDRIKVSSEDKKYVGRA